MKIVGTDRADVEVGLLAGELACPNCGGVLGPWGDARSRLIRFVDCEEQRTLRRTRCRSCRKTHVLLPNDLLARRRDGVEVIGDALAGAAGGSGFRCLARKIDRPPDTVRGWLRRFGSIAEVVRVYFTRWAVDLDSESFEIAPTGSLFGDAIAAISAAGKAAVLAGVASHPWRFVSGVTIGGLLCNTTSPWAGP